MLDLISGPTEADVLALVSVEQMRAQKRIVTRREDDLIKDCILDAWSFLDGPEGKCRRAVLPQNYRLSLSCWPGSRLVLPVHGAREVSKIEISIAGGSPITVDPATYRTIRSGDGIDTIIYFAISSGIASMNDGLDTVAIEFAAGWPDAQQVPRAFRRALRLIAAHFYDNREETFGDSRVSTVSRSIELGASKLLEKWIVPLEHKRR